MPSDPARTFADVYRLLGQVKKLLDDLSVECPGPYYERAIAHLNRASDTVSAWKTAEET
jgi:hypothetical protein